MSRTSLSCLVALSMTSALLPVASAHRLAPQPDYARVPMPDPTMDLQNGGDAPLDPVVAPSRAELRAALIAARAKNLASFRTYWKGGVYPSNVYSKDLLNVWRDEDGHFCAAATIMVKSGNQALAIKLAEGNNFIRLADVDQGPVMDWILTSGFTQEELVSIQKPFMGVSKRPIPSEGQPQQSAMPFQPMKPVVDARLRKAETARLLAKYKVVDKQLVARQRKSLELAVDRLMVRPALAWTIVHSQS
jgi:hypothetical protein